MTFLNKLREWFPNTAKNLTLEGPQQGITSGISTYSGSDITNTSSDFLGDWRAADSWMRFDLLRVRQRSRQIERGNPWAQSFSTSLINNVLGAKGINRKMKVRTGRQYGDATDDQPDEYANKIIDEARAEFEKAKNFTSRKQLTRRDADRLLLKRLCFDGEIIMRKRPGFRNDFNFTWQIIDPDYLDHNLNRLEPNGNLIRMGVELDGQDKFPVAYWFLNRRPNDYTYNYTQIDAQRHERVPASEVLHVFLQTLDSEQTRGWPWVFAAAINLFRLGKYEEAALVNAAIGANKQGFYKKAYPDGWEGESLDDRGNLIDFVEPGSWVELPYGVEPVPFDNKYPEAQFGEFCKAMLRSISASMGISYMSMTGDLSEANFSSLRAGLNEEREQWMQLQDFFIERVKEPEFEEWLYRALLSQKVKLPISKFSKFNKPQFTGRRWPFVNPLQDLQAKQLAIDNCITSISATIHEQGGDAEEVFRQLADEAALMEKYGIKRVHSSFQYIDGESDEPQTPPAKPKAAPQALTPRKTQNKGALEHV